MSTHISMHLCVQLLFFVVMLAKLHRESVKLLREGGKYIKNVWNVIEVSVSLLYDTIGNISGALKC